MEGQEHKLDFKKHFSLIILRLGPYISLDLTLFLLQRTRTQFLLLRLTLLVYSHLGQGGLVILTTTLSVCIYNGVCHIYKADTVKSTAHVVINTHLKYLRECNVHVTE